MPKPLSPERAERLKSLSQAHILPPPTPRMGRGINNRELNSLIETIDHERSSFARSQRALGRPATAAGNVPPFKFGAPAGLPATVEFFRGGSVYGDVYGRDATEIAAAKRLASSRSAPSFANSLPTLDEAERLEAARAERRPSNARRFSGSEDKLWFRELREVEAANPQVDVLVLYAQRKLSNRYRPGSTFHLKRTGRLR
jgi:hypothetical protein